MENNKFYKISNFIVNKKNIFVIICAILCAISIYTIRLTEVEEDLLAYLDEESLTKTGLSKMEEEFEDMNISARVMVENISEDEATKITEELQQKEGVALIELSEYKNDSNNDKALFSITFDTNNNDEALAVMGEIEKHLEDYETSVDSSVYLGDIEGLNQDMVVIAVIVLALILLIVTFTSRSFAEIPILLIVFAVAALINMGTNFIFGKISFISNAVAVILQLALAIDYALILIHRFAEEKEKDEKKDAKEVCKIALSKAIPEISSSSLTTIFSLIALSFMTYTIGLDLSKVLIKSIIISLLCVFTLMPALVVMFSKAIEKTKHRNFVPNIEKIGKIALKTRYVLLPLFIIVTVAAGFYSYKTNYEFYESGASKQYKEEIEKMDNTFGSENSIVVLIPNNDAEKQEEYIQELIDNSNVKSVLSLYTLEVIEGVTLDSELTYKNALGVEEEMSYPLFLGYANTKGEAELFLEDPTTYVVSVYDLIYFMHENLDNEQMQLSDELKQMVTYQMEQINVLEETFESEKYSRIIINVDLELEGKETFEFVEKLEKLTNEYFEENYLLGNSINSYELSNAFKIDNKVISALSIVFIAIILICTFKSVLTSFSMIIVIQSAIYINFAFPYIQGIGLYFIGYLMVIAIQMGANIDYAIVITNRYKLLAKTLNPKEAIIKALNEAFPTIITSGSILAIAGVVLHNVSSNTIIATLGLCIGRGTLISMCLVLVVLPQLLHMETSLRNKLSKKQMK